jgi:penicillin-binding protein 1A
VAKAIIHRSSFYIFTIPLFIASAVVKLINHRSLIDDYNECADLINSTTLDNDIITQSLATTLVLAEDHRNSVHFGVDQLAVIRAIFVRLIFGELQGASTIEQQFVRTVSRRYERTIRRKIREQVLAVMIAQNFSKRQIHNSYMSCAFFGSGLSGAKGIRLLKDRTKYVGDDFIVACLKYPMPLNPSEKHLEIHLRRVRYIQHLKRIKRMEEIGDIEQK